MNLIYSNIKLKLNYLIYNTILCHQNLEILLNCSFLRFSNYMFII